MHRLPEDGALRDIFAASAIPALIAALDPVERYDVIPVVAGRRTSEEHHVMTKLAYAAYCIADEMLRVRELNL